jgi:hypothetical protein
VSPPPADETPEVRAVRARLAALGADTRPVMPPQIAERIDAALADEAARGRPADASGTVLPARRDELAARRDRRRRVAIGLAAAVAAVAVTLTAAQLNDNGGSRDASSAGGSNAGDTASGPAPAPSAVAGGRPVASGRHYTAARLPQQVDALLSSAPAARKQQEGAPNATARGLAKPLRPAARLDAPTGLDPLLDPDRLRGCITSLKEPDGVRPLAVDLATFERKPALIIVMPGGKSDAGTVHVYVVGGDCAAGADHLLRYQVVPRR